MPHRAGTKHDAKSLPLGGILERWELLEKYSLCMACMAHGSVLVVDLTFGEAYDAPQRAQPSQRPEPRKIWTTENTEGTEKRNEDSCSDTASVWPLSPLW